MPPDDSINRRLRVLMWGVSLVLFGQALWSATVDSGAAIVLGVMSLGAMRIAAEAAAAEQVRRDRVIRPVRLGYDPARFDHDPTVWVIQSDDDW